MSQPRHLVLLVLLILSGPLFLNACGKNLTAEEYVLQAKEHLQTGDLRAANIELANALQRDPEAVEARWLMAQVALELGDAPTAESEARRALQLGMSRAEVQPLLVEAALRQGAFDRTLAETTSLPDEATDADKAKMLGLRGQVFVLKGDIQRAEAALEDALSFDSQAPHALVGLAVLHATQRQPEEARRWLTAALEANPATPEAWGVLGELELAQGNLEEAEAAFGNAIQHRSYPTLDRAHRALARVQLEKLEEAAADIQALQRRGLGEHHYVNYVAGLLRFAEGNYTEAASAFETSFMVEPTFLPSRLYLATTRLILGQPEQARLHAQYVYSNVPGSPAAGRLIGAARIGLSEYAAAREVLEATLPSVPDDRTTLGMLATVALFEGDAASGVHHLRRLSELEPDSQQVQDMLMLARLMSGESLDDPVANGTPAESDQPDRYEQDLLRALEAFRDNRIGEALQRATRLHELHPERIDPINLMAASFLALGDWGRARIELEKVLALQPNNLSAIRNLAKVELQTGDASRAKHLLERIQEEHPGDEEVALLLAQAEARLGDLPAGMRVLERLLRSNPDALTARARLAGEHLRARNTERVLELTSGLNDRQLQAQPALLELRGKAQMLRGDVGAASESFERWTRLAPDSAEAHFFHGDTLARRGEVAQARLALERAIQLDPQHLLARIGEIKMLVELGEVDEAHKRVAGLKEEFGDRTEVLGIEGWFALGTGDFATAERSLATVWERDPDTEVTILLARSLWRQAKHAEVLQLLDDWLAREPRDLAVLLHLAGAYLSLDREDDALAVYRRVIEAQPEHVPALNNIAWLSREQDPKEALKYAERAYDLAPEDPYVLDTLGMLKLLQGDIDGAYLRIQEAADRAPADAQIQLHLARVLLQMGEVDAAREILDMLVTLVPDSAPGQEARELLQAAETR